MKRFWWIIGIVVVLAIAGYVGVSALARRSQDPAATVQTATVSRGEITTSLSSAGTVRAGQSATIKWQTSGQVGAVTVKPGDPVEKDQELAALDAANLSSSVINARQNLIDAQQKLEDLLNSTLQQAQAQQALSNAQEALNQLTQDTSQQSAQAQLALATAQQAVEAAQKARDKLNYPHSSDSLVIEKAQTDYLLAKEQYKDALQAYNAVDHKRLTDPQRVAALNRLLTARQKMDRLFATYNWYLQMPTPADIAEADANLAVAQANLIKAQADYDSLKGGPQSAAVALAEATLADAQRAWDRVKDGPNSEDVAAAQAAVEAAQATLNQVRLLAPFTGTVTEVDTQPGDVVSGGSAAFRIDDLASLYVDLQVSEVDLNSLQLGQPADLTFDAVADKQYTGEVVEIGMVGVVTQGVVNYPVTVRITNPDASVKPGMTAAVSIVIASRENVLLVPNQALRVSAGERTVTVLYEGQQINVVVTVGLVNETMSEISSEQLREGDAVVINGSSTASSSNANNGQFQQMRVEGPFIMEGGPPP